MTATQGAIQDMLDGKDLTSETIEACLKEIVEGTATPVQIGGLLVALRKKGETVEEIAAFASTLRGYGEMKDRPSVKGRMIDMCGTGGDVVKTPNVSTISAFVAAGAGAIVAKHGGPLCDQQVGERRRPREAGLQPGDGALAGQGLHRAAGHRVHVRPCIPPSDEAGRTGEEGARGEDGLQPHGAPHQPRARRRAAAGPLHARPWYPQVAAVLGRLGLQEAIVVHGLEGVDEISVTGKTLVSHLKDGETTTREYSPREFGLKDGPLFAATGPADAEEGAMLALSILSGDAEERDCGTLMVLVNSAACLVLAQKSVDLRRGHRAGSLIDKERQGDGEAGADGEVQRREPGRGEGEVCKARKVRRASSSPSPAPRPRTSKRATIAESDRTQASGLKRRSLKDSIARSRLTPIIAEIKFTSPAEGKLEKPGDVSEDRAGVRARRRRGHLRPHGAQALRRRHPLPPAREEGRQACPSS